MVTIKPQQTSTLKSYDSKPKKIILKTIAATGVGGGVGSLLRPVGELSPLVKELPRTFYGIRKNDIAKLSKVRAKLFEKLMSEEPKKIWNSLVEIMKKYDKSFSPKYKTLDILIKEVSKLPEEGQKEAKKIIRKLDSMNKLADTVYSWRNKLPKIAKRIRNFKLTSIALSALAVGGVTYIYLKKKSN